MVMKKALVHTEDSIQSLVKAQRPIRIKHCAWSHCAYNVSRPVHAQIFTEAQIACCTTQVLYRQWCQVCAMLSRPALRLDDYEGSPSRWHIVVRHYRRLKHACGEALYCKADGNAAGEHRQQLPLRS